ncbi:MAG TPA: hypothetical protein VJO52_09565 [Gemmatimonadaceae bacterium]|nr:hypothetical protein [Gemmatimonadaceae bacterium]
MLSEADLDDLQRELLRDPHVGAVIAGSGGARKVRLGIGARGKRGGVRVIHYFHDSAARVYLLLAYPKNAADNLSSAGLRAVRQIITAIERDA